MYNTKAWNHAYINAFSPNFFLVLMCTLLYMSVVTKLYFINLILCTYTLDLLLHVVFCNGNHKHSKLDFFFFFWSERNSVTTLEFKMVNIGYGHWNQIKKIRVSNEVLRVVPHSLMVNVFKYAMMPSSKSLPPHYSWLL